MEIVQDQNVNFGRLLRKQRVADGGPYRLLTYCVSLSVDAGLLVYNTLSCEMVLLQGDEVRDILSLPYLVEHWFLVPQNFDDRKLARQYRHIHALIAPKGKYINNYTILTTTDCNARCFYCYEMGRSRIPMSEETAEKVAGYIKNNHANDARHRGQNLTWFGGEPLYNYKAIDLICSRLKESDVPFHSIMISNGYLLSPELVERAKTLWNLIKIQITLDGTEEVYNRSKSFVYREGSAFQRVMRNIGLLLDAGILVYVRLNMDLYNSDDLMSLAHLLAETFPGRKGLFVYCSPLFEAAAGKRSSKRTEEGRQEIYLKQRKLTALLERLGLGNQRQNGVDRDIRNQHCMADSQHSVVIAPTGDLGLCEHYSDDNFFSHIDTPEVRDENVMRSFSERCEDLDICDDCAIYPQCIRLKKCEEGSLCSAMKKLQRNDLFKMRMMISFKRWNKKRNYETEVPILDQPSAGEICGCA